jgi:multidrug efflux pump subunit AcrA (membrane-fusion protein)
MTDATEPDARSERGRADLPEGEEAPPPGTRTAAIVRWALVGIMAVAAAGAWTWSATQGDHAAGARFRCPMHPTVVMDRPGECPVCGMDLVQALAGPEPAVAGEGAAGAGYTCPMHPAFVSADPRTRCPECGMKLVPRGADVGRGAGDAPAVPGLAPVELSAERIQLAGVKTAVAAREPLASTLRTVGFVAANEKGLASVNLRFAGWIESVRAGDLGQYVERGEILATVYSPDAVVAQQQFLATARWAEPAVPGAPPPEAMTPQRDVSREARRRLELLGFAAQDVDALAASGTPSNVVNVRAPARGHVARRAAVRGVFVQPGTELFQIADLSTVWVIADVHESDIGRVKVGQRAVLELTAWPGERFAGRITFVYPALAAGSRTLQARIELPNPGLRLRPGMYGDVTVELGAAAAVVVPADAVVDTGELQYAFVSKGSGRFEPRRVRVGWSGAGKVAILEGLEAGERVVTTANFLLDSESRLRAAAGGAVAR